MYINNSKTKDSKTNYVDPVGLGMVDLHYYGAYMSYSDDRRDYLRKSEPMIPFTVSTTQTVKVGETMEVYKEPVYSFEYRADVGHEVKTLQGQGESKVRTVPITESRLVTEVPAYKAMGKPIKAGDTVEVDGVSGVSGPVVIKAIEDTHIILTTEHGDMYLPWTQGVSINRQH